jgi:anaerobic ribonucleoside-triphosphate reductase
MRKPRRGETGKMKTTTDNPVESKSITLNENERQRCEVWTRVMGYHRPVSEFNAGKQSEHYERHHFVEPKEGIK